MNRQNCKPERFDRPWNGLLKTQKCSSSSLIEGSKDFEHSHLPTYPRFEQWECKKKKKKMKVVRIRDGNFSLPLLASPRMSFPHPTKVVRQGWGKILVSHHRVGRGWV